MLELKIEPRFCETDALGHINNAVLLEWFEQGRIPIFKIFTPDLDPKKWRLILAHNSVDYLKQIHFGKLINLKTYISKLGNSSMVVEHELFQEKQKVAHGKAIMIHFNYKSSTSLRIPDKERDQLYKYLIEEKI